MRRPGSPIRGLHRKRSGADGFSIIELMLAIFVLAVIMTAVAAALGTAMRVSRGNTNRVVAANIAAGELDQIREDSSQDFDKLTNLLGQTTVTKTVKNVPYTVTRDVNWVSGGANSSPCDGSASATSAYVRVTVEVTWSQLSGVRPVTSQTVIAPPVGVYDPNTGNAAVKILSAAGKPQENIKVELVGPTGAETPQYTTTDGCAFFAFLPAGVVHGDHQRDGLRRPAGRHRAVADHRRERCHDDAVPVRVRRARRAHRDVPGGLQHHRPGVRGRAAEQRADHALQHRLHPDRAQDVHRHRQPPQHPEPLSVHRGLRRVGRHLHRRRPGPVRHEPAASGDLRPAGRDLDR